MGRPGVALGVVIQARMCSTRLPGKILQPIGDRPLLDHILGRLDGLQHAARIVIATSDRLEDGVVLAFCAERGVECFRGSEHDVLARYYECARQRGFTQVVRLTGDNPFTDVDELNRLIEFHLAGSYDFSSSFEDLPVGVGAEIFTFAALERSFHEGHSPHHREHVDEYILENRDRFRIGRLGVPAWKRHPEVRLTVDTAEDLRRAQFVAEHAAGPWATTEDAINLCLRFA
jgi:spore coat polysaccharide biosynthesis protein SpsF